MIFGDNAVTAMYKYLNSNIEILGLDKGCIFKYERPGTFSGDKYIAINHLPFVTRNVVQEGVVNVNIHVKKTATIAPNTKQLTAILSNMINKLFSDETYLGGAYFEYYSDSRPTADNDDTYYINVKFNVIYNNLKQ